VFTGIIERVGKVVALSKEQSNLHITISSDISSELKVDQSVAHNGVCLTVVKIIGNQHVVTAIDETLTKTNLKDWNINDIVNLERCLQANARLDGHIVQGHVDATAVCVAIEDQNGSWLFTFEYTQPLLTVEKGSICVNGVSLTVINSKQNSFSVAIIPYTYQHTCFQSLIIGDNVNLEFDIVGKYISKLLSLHYPNQL
jgi:riboflavin synthase